MNRRAFLGLGAAGGLMLVDNQMPIDRTARVFVPQLTAGGYAVTLREYDCGYRVPRAVVREAYQWFVARDKQQSA